jgi:hypothetical protein
MRGSRVRWLAGLGVVLAAGAAWAGGIFCALEERGYVVGKVVSLPRAGTIGLMQDAREVQMGPRTVLVAVRTVGPAAVPPGLYVLMPRTAGGETPGWIFTADTDKDLAALAEAVGCTEAKPKQVGGIASCTLYTPCRKCQVGFAETISRRRNHPVMLRVRRIEPETVRLSQYVVTPQTAPGASAPWILVFERDRDILALHDTVGIGGR